MYQGVIFDLDGTLLNTLKDLADAGNYALASQGLPIHDTEKYRYFVGNGIPMLIKRIVPPQSSEETVKNTHRLFSEYYEQHMRDNTRPYQGVTRLLDRLRENKVRTAVVTNKAHQFAVEIVKDYFGDRIETVIGQQEGIAKKPDPEAVLRIQRMWQLEKSRVLYAGDSNVDMETAENGGFDSCGVLWGFRDKEELEASGAKFTVSNTEELYRIICS